MKSLVNLGREASAVAPAGMSPQEWARACKGPLRPCKGPLCPCLVELECREDQELGEGRPSSLPAGGELPWSLNGPFGALACRGPGFLISHSEVWAQKG